MELPGIELSNGCMVHERDVVERNWIHSEVEETPLNSSELKDFSIEEKIDEPILGMSFNSLDEMFEYYTNYANQLGFPVKKRSCSKGADGQLKYMTIACARSGVPCSSNNNPLKLRASVKTDCKALLRAVLTNDGNWQVNSCNNVHNHDMSPGKARYFRCNRVIKPHVKRKLEINDLAGIRVNKNFNSIVVEVGGHENMTFLEKDCRNFIDKVRRLRLGDGDASAVQSYFMKMQVENANFFYTMDLDDDGRLKNLFWADARSRSAYSEFSDVITFDTTYLTNKYDMPFAPFVGVNHHGQSILFGCGLISNENTETFTWLFRSWLTCMSGCAPCAIITDQDQAMKKAIEIVFPNARHRWCLWHILKKVPEKLKSYHKYESIKFFLLNAVYESLTTKEFEEKWCAMIEKYDLHNNDWLNGLYHEKSRWVPCFVKDAFWAGMSTTQRSEGMNSFFDGYVNSKTTLKQFVEQYDNALRDKVEKERLGDYKSFSQDIPCVTIYDMEKQMQSIYTLSKFKEFQTEITGMMYCDLSFGKCDVDIEEYDVCEHMTAGEGKKKKTTYKVLFHKTRVEIKCNCRLLEFRGILCRHGISVLIRNDILLIPNKYILRRWRKDVVRSHTRVKVGYNDRNASPEALRQEKMYNAFSEVVELATMSDDKCLIVMDSIQTLKEKLSVNVEDNESHHTLGGEDTNNRTVVNATSTIHSPVSVRGKGRPPFKRKQSKVEKIITKKKNSKKAIKRKGIKAMDELTDKIVVDTDFGVAYLPDKCESEEFIAPTDKSSTMGRDNNDIVDATNLITNWQEWWQEWA